MSKWPAYRLADLCDSIDYGYTASAKESPVGPRFLRITDIVPGHINWQSVPHCEIETADAAGYRLHHGDVVIARTGATTGVSAYIANPPDAVFASYLVRLKVGSKADARFIAYFLKSEDFWDYMRGVLGDKSAQPNASARTMTQVKLHLPPLPDQRAIAAVLGALDDKIELNRRMNETLEALAQSLFKSWFVDASQDGLPKGWREVSVADEVELVKGVSYRSEELADTDTALVTLKSVKRGGGYRTDGLKPYIGEFEPEQVIKPGELVVAHTDVTQAAEVIGKPALVLPDERIKTLVASLDLSIARPKVGDLSQHFFYLLFLTADFQAHVYGHTNGTTVLHLAKSGVPSYRFARPPETVARAFTEVVRPLFERISTNEMESRTLAALRDALLPKLLSGKLRVGRS